MRVAEIIAVCNSALLEGWEVALINKEGKIISYASPREMQPRKQ